MTDDLIRLCCYMARQEARTGNACVTVAEFHRIASDGNGDALMRLAFRGGLIKTAGRIVCGLEKRAIWRLTEDGRRTAASAPPELQAWRMAPPPRAEVAA